MESVLLLVDLILYLDVVYFWMHDTYLNLGCTLFFKQSFYR